MTVGVLTIFVVGGENEGECEDERGLEGDDEGEGDEEEDEGPTLA